MELESVRVVVRRRDDCSDIDVDEMIAEFKTELEFGGDPDDLIQDIFGLEPDYLLDDELGLF